MKLKYSQFRYINADCLNITTRTTCKVITSLPIRNHGTHGSNVGSVDRHECTNCLYEQANLIFYTP